MKRKIIIECQKDVKDCGPCCLSSIIKFYDVSSDDLDDTDITITMSLNRFEELIKSIGEIVTKYTNQTDFDSLSMHIIDEKLI